MGAVEFDPADLYYLNQHVWSSKLKIGELEIAYLFSCHDAKDFSCNQVVVIDAETAKAIRAFSGR